LIGALPADPSTVPPTLRYFLDIVKILDGMQAQDLTAKSMLVGSPEKIINDLRTVEASGIGEVILYFNYGLKPPELVKEQMGRFMAEIAPAFATGTSDVRPTQLSTVSP
jgi:hypothetical protein